MKSLSQLFPGMDGMENARFARGTITCRGCGQKFETVYTVVRTRKQSEPQKYTQKEMCSKCDPHGPSLEPVRQRNDRVERWDRLCKHVESPLTNVKADDLPTDLAYEVLHYQYPAQGLFFAGRGTAMPLYAVLRILFMQGRSIRIVNARRFIDQSQAAFAGEFTRSWVDSFLSIDVVAFEGFGELTLNERQCIDWLDIMRLRSEKPTFGSSSITGTELMHKLPSSHAKEVLLTIKDSFKIIRLTPQD